VKVSSRARRHEDRGGDPLDGLVNLFDLGIVLAVAFLISALASLDLESVLTDDQAAQSAAAAANEVTATEDEEVKPIELEPGERVVGAGEEIGTVYQLEDGRTVIVRPKDSEPVPGEEPTEVPEPGEEPAGAVPVPEGLPGEFVPGQESVP
jgi:hypothetical protein